MRDSLPKAVSTRTITWKCFVSGTGMAITLWVCQKDPKTDGGRRNNRRPIICITNTSHHCTRRLLPPIGTKRQNSQLTVHGSGGAHSTLARRGGSHRVNKNVKLLIKKEKQQTQLSILRLQKIKMRGIVKRQRKPNVKLIVAPFPEK